MKERTLDELQLDNENERNQAIVFDLVKNEFFKLTENYKTLHRKLKVVWKVTVNKDPLNKENKILEEAKVLVFAVPKLFFDNDEIEALHNFIKSGKSILLLSSEGGDSLSGTNLNDFLEKYGISINNDNVLRTQYYKYFHPKECYINDVTGRLFGQQLSDRPCFLYPYGSSLNVTKPSIVTFICGDTAYPANRPISAVYVDQKTGGRIAVLGSGHMLCDKYIDQESNDRFCEAVFKFLTDSTDALNYLDADEFDIWDYHLVPDIPSLAERPQLCLVDSTTPIPVTTDFTKLFDTKLYSLNTDLVPEILTAYKELDVKHCPLTLIVPHFEEVTPPLQLSVFPPSFSELSPPPLELFDLEEEFSGDDTRLARITNRYISETHGDEGTVETIDDIANYIKEASDIIGIGQPDTVPRRLLYECASFVSEFKMANHEENKE